MIALFLALALAAADPAPAAEASAEAEAPRMPVGAPSDDYGLVGWCYGALGGYLDLYDEVMPEVTRIETTWRRPGSNLAEDLKVYADMRKEGRSNLKLFEQAIEAAEKASIRPISSRGQEAVRKGRSIWTAAATMPKARVAQEWMSWALPAVCTSTAERLKSNAGLMAATFDTATPAPSDAPAADAPQPEAAPAPEPQPGGIDVLLESVASTGSAKAPNP